MTTLHVCNAFFEWEIEKAHTPTIYEAFCSHRNFLYLQFLPLIYAPINDAILVTENPSFNQRRFSTINEKQTFFTHIQSFAASESVKRFAILHNLIYQVPPLDVVKEVASKEFSFRNSPKLPGSKLITNPTELSQFLSKGDYKKVLKTPFGFSGVGHFFSDPKSNASAKTTNLQPQPNSPLIGEPWVQRVFDFSSHWFIDNDTKEIVFLGFTKITSSPRGQFVSATPLHPPLYYKNQDPNQDQNSKNRQIYNLKSPFQKHPNLQEHLTRHKEEAFKLLEKIQSYGFFGEISFDSFIYDEDTLHPIVEINPRKTLGKIAYELNKTLVFRKRKKHMSNDASNPNYFSNNKPLLPTHLSGVRFPMEIVLI